MVSVRFPLDLVTKARYWAKRDGMTLSQWVRHLITKELARPQRQPPVDVFLYPQSQTVPSSAHVKIQFDGLPQATGTWTA